jgi:hypothetical protein
MIYWSYPCTIIEYCIDPISPPSFPLMMLYVLLLFIASFSLPTLMMQVGGASAPLFAYALPNVTSVSPASAGTLSDAASPTTITVTGIDFGLCSASVGVVVGFGNAGDGSFSVRAVLSRTPALVTVSAPGFAGVPGQAEAVTFALASGVGSNRAVRVVPYLLALGPPTAAQVLATPSYGLFSYAPPSLSLVAVNAITTETLVDCAAAGVCVGSQDPTSVRRLTLIGANFGPSPSATNDSIGRAIEYAPSIGGPWSPTATVLYNLANWTQESVIAYTPQFSGAVRIAFALQDPSGVPYSIYSQPLPYADYSPSVSEVQGDPSLANVPTEGGWPIVVQGENLGNTQVLNVTVGSYQAIMLNASGGVPVDPTQVSKQEVWFSR